MNSNPSSGGVVLARRAGKVLVLTINRPAACNAMSRAVYGGIIGHMKEAETDPEVLRMPARSSVIEAVHRVTSLPAASR